MRPDDDEDDMTEEERIDWQDYLDESRRARIDDEAERFPGWHP